MLMNLLAPSPSRMIACASSLATAITAWLSACVAGRGRVGELDAGLTGGDQDEGVIGRGIAVDGDAVE
jgi:hypothetical protein